jgi:hypothetical protein
MILPVVAYGSPILRKVCDDIDAGYAGLEKLLVDMWETLYNSNGVGLAAPQINKPIRLFIVDTDQIVADFEEEDLKKYPENHKETFILFSQLLPDDLYLLKHICFINYSFISNDLLLNIFGTDTDRFQKSFKNLQQF